MARPKVGYMQIPCKIKVAFDLERNPILNNKIKVAFGLEVHSQSLLTRLKKDQKQTSNPINEMKFTVSNEGKAREFLHTQ